MAPNGIQCRRRIPHRVFARQLRGSLSSSSFRNAGGSASRKEGLESSHASTGTHLFSLRNQGRRSAGTPSESQTPRRWRGRRGATAAEYPHTIVTGSAVMARRCRSTPNAESANTLRDFGCADRRKGQCRHRSGLTVRQRRREAQLTRQTETSLPKE